MTDPLRNAAMQKLSEFRNEIAEMYHESWKSAQAEIEQEATTRDKSFEVHHRIETARRCFLKALYSGAHPETVRNTP